jgi:outer membrane receptor for ferrienterochelin and colicin
VGTVHAFDHATRRGAPAFYRAILMTSACGGLTVSPAVAQEAPAVPGEEEAGEQIVVNGSRPIVRSEAALQVQKMSDSLVAVAASDSVGRLPDQNIAQAASRLPGIAVERDQGQARYISLRGAPKNWTTLSFDGINVVSPEGRNAR